MIYEARQMLLASAGRLPGRPHFVYGPTCGFSDTDGHRTQPVAVSVIVQIDLITNYALPVYNYYVSSAVPALSLIHI